MQALETIATHLQELERILLQPSVRKLSQVDANQWRVANVLSSMHPHISMMGKERRKTHAACQKTDLDEAARYTVVSRSAFNTAGVLRRNLRNRLLVSASAHQKRNRTPPS